MAVRTYRVSVALAAMMAAAAVAPAPALAERPVAGSGVEPSAQQNSAERPIGFAAAPAANGGVLLLLIPGAALPAAAAAALDAGERAGVERALAAASFDGKAGSSLALRGIGRWAHIAVRGIGADGTALDIRKAAGQAAQGLLTEAQPVQIIGDLSGQQMAEAALGYGLGQYRYDRLKTDRKPAATQKVTVVGSDVAGAQQWWTGRYAGLVSGMRLARNLINEPSNIIYPESFVTEARAAFAGVAGVSIDVLDEPAMRRLNMGALLSVGQGSRRPSRLMVIRYRGAGSAAAPLALVGKGVTFDTGGVSMKPALNMWNMRADMSGAGAVVGTALALAQSRAPVHIVAVVPLAENMVDGNATRPGDVVRSMRGKTIEVLNTDAEGRMVLADALEYSEAMLKPRAIVDIATLTGAVVGALGSDYAGLFSRDDALAGAITAAGTASGDAVWRLPMHPGYAQAMRSDIADLRNISLSGGPGAGVAAHFLGEFVTPATPWAHLDIAGMNRSDSARPLGPMGATGYGVALLEELARTLP